MTDDSGNVLGRKRSEVDLATVRERLASARGRDYWRSLEELADTAAFRELLHREFPHGILDRLDAVGRRTFLKLMGASMAMLGLGACSPAAAPIDEKIVPYVEQPVEITPGVPLFYATAMPQQGYGTWAAQPRSKAIRFTPPAWAQPTSSPRRRCWGCTIPTAPTR